jgi:hypothetical protein
VIAPEVSVTAIRVTAAVAVAVDSPYECEVAVVAAVSTQAAEALAAQPTCPEPGRVTAKPVTASRPLLTRIDAADASRTVAEDTVLVTEGDSRPVPVAVTTVVVAVAVESANLK